MPIQDLADQRGLRSKLTRMLLNTSALRPGDLLFSSTPGLVSQGIRMATGSDFSHASIYYGSGVLLEANDKGVGPTRIRPSALAPDGGVAGLPYDDWTTVSVLRHARYSDGSSWQVAMRTALRESVGYDFPPMSVMAEGSKSLLGFLGRPIGLVMDLIERLQNRAPIAWDAWCSRLVGYVLQEHFSHRLSERHRAALQYASPQRLFEIAKSLGYELVPAATCQASTDASDVQFQEARTQYLSAQETVYQEWSGYAAQRRKALVAEETVRATRFNGKLLAVIALAIAGISAVVMSGKKGVEDSNEGLAAIYPRLEGMLAIYSVLSWRSPQQTPPKVKERSETSGSELTLNCPKIAWGTGGVDQTDSLFSCFSEPRTVYVPEEGEEVETIQLISAEEYSYEFTWNSVFGYELEVSLRGYEGFQKNSPIGRERDACMEETQSASTCYFNMYKVTLSGLTVSKSVSFLTANGRLSWNPDGTVQPVKERVIYLDNQTPVTPAQLNAVIQRTMRALGSTEQDVARIAPQLEAMWMSQDKTFLSTLFGELDKAPELAQLAAYLRGR